MASCDDLSVQSDELARCAAGQRHFGARVENEIVQPPLFILGHWRSGTTHLLNLLSHDNRFAYPNAYQVAFPHTFLSAEGGVNYKLLKLFLPRTRPMDNMRLDLNVPFEDEYATCTTSQLSPYMSYVFPKRREYFDRYLTLRDVPEAETERWRNSLMTFLKKLTHKYQRPLILKSPPHTCRIALLLKMFPDARFVHIYRHPLTIFQSTQHQTKVALKWYALQDFRADHIDDWTIQRYRHMYDVFFDERSLIPVGQFADIRFEDLENDPLGQLRTLYERLHLTDFEHIEPPLRDYIKSLSGYRKNVFADLSPALSERVIDQWCRSFAEWGYSATV